eukprot:157610-Amphidinium_carterae.1
MIFTLATPIECIALIPLSRELDRGQRSCGTSIDAALGSHPVKHLTWRSHRVQVMGGPAMRFVTPSFGCGRFLREQ